MGTGIRADGYVDREAQRSKGRACRSSSLSGDYQPLDHRRLSLTLLKLDRLGVRLGFLPNEPAFAMGEDEGTNGDEVTNRNRASKTITNSEILSFLNNQSSFYDLYIRLTNRAIELYVKAGRRKFALRLHGSLAALDL